MPLLLCFLSFANKKKTKNGLMKCLKAEWEKRENTKERDGLFQWLTSYMRYINKQPWAVIWKNQICVAAAWDWTSEPAKANIESGSSRFDLSAHRENKIKEIHLIQCSPVSCDDGETNTPSSPRCVTRQHFISGMERDNKTCESWEESEIKGVNPVAANLLIQGMEDI